MSEADEQPVTDSAIARRGRVRRRRTGWRNADVLRTAALVIAMYVLVRLFWFANMLFFTAFLGLLFGLAVSSGVDGLARWRIPRGVSAALIVVGFLGILSAFGAWIAPTIHQQGIELQRRLPDAIDRAGSWVDAHRGGVIGMVFGGLATEARTDSAATNAAPAAAPTAGAADSTQAAAMVRQRINAQLGGLSRYLFPFISSTIEVVAGILIIIFLSIYIAVDPGTYRTGIMHLFPRRRRARAGEVLSAIAQVLRRWLVTQLIAMAVIGVVTTIVLLVLRVQAAFALGLLSGLFEFIPTFGPIISALPAVAMGFLDSPEKAAYVALAYMLVQFMENHLLIPLLMKGGIDLPPVLTILSQALMALVFGFIGLMVAVPILAATMVAVKMLYVEDIVGDPQLGAGENPARGVEA
ncbi:MAG TPA: AI-2E family transporter [Gemmatimonadaceae bacterium]|nr:AI-2E family transporter [Gemmatimonadaceae bacterium]